MAAIVQYDGKQPWGSYPPYVSVEVTPVAFGQNWYETRNINLAGRISQKMLTQLGVSGFEAMRTRLENTFSVNNKRFMVHSSNTLEIENVFVNSISFNQQRWSGLLEYSVSLTGYDFHSELLGLLNPDKLPIFEPVDQFDVQTNEDQTFTLTHTASAKSMGTMGDTSTNDAIVDWVKARITAGSDRVVPGWSLENHEYIVVGEEEQLDRFNGSYSFVKKYLIHDLSNGTTSTSKPLIRINATINEGITQDYPVVSVEGVVKGGKTDDWNTSVLPTAWANIGEDSLRSSASTLLANYGAPALSAIECENYSFDEEFASNSCKAKASFEVRGVVDPVSGYFDHEISIEMDNVSGVCKVDVDGEIKFKGGIDKRRQGITNFLNAHASNLVGYLYVFASSAYNAAGLAVANSANNGATLRSVANDVQVTRNDKRGTLSLSASFDDEHVANEWASSSWSVTAKTSVPYTKANPSGKVGTNGYWSIQSFDFSTRWRLSVNHSLSFREDTSMVESLREANVRSSIDQNMGFLLTQYGTGGGYTTNKSIDVSIGTVYSGSGTEEKSFPASLPLIDINIGALLAPPQPR